MKKNHIRNRLIIKRITSVLLATTFVISLSGCTQLVEMTDEQEDQIVEYIAGTMLKYSYANAWDYAKVRKRIGYYDNNIEPTTQAPTQAPSTQSGSSQQSSENETKSFDGGDSISNLISSLGLENCTITFDGFVVGSKYPTTEFAVCVPANEGCKVVAAEFTITNNSGVANTITTKGSTSMKLVIGDKTIGQYVSPLVNDLGAMTNVKLENMESYKTVVIFQVEEGLAAEIDSAKLQAYKGTTHIGTFPE